MNTSNTVESVPIAPEPPAIPSVLRAPCGHKRNGKIAHLPKAVRDKINQWLDDGHTYPQIIKDLGDDAKDLKPNHFSEWRKGGYQDYLRQQEWRDQLRLLRENGSEITELDDGPEFQQNLIQLALTEIFRVLQQRELKSDSLNFIRLFNALARLNREALGLRKYNDLLAKEQAELKKLEIGRKMSPNEHRAIVDEADRIFRMPRPRPEGSSARAASDSLPPRPASPEPRSSLGKSGSDREEAQISDRPATSNSRTSEPETCPDLSKCAKASPSPWGEGRGEGDRTVLQPAAPRDKRTHQLPTAASSPIKNRKSKIKNSSPDPRPSCAPSPSTPDPRPSCSPPPTNPESRIEYAVSRPPNPESSIEHPASVPSPIENQNGSTSLVSKIENPLEYCLDCHHPLPPLTPEGKRPNERCDQCNILLPPPGTCTRPSSDKCVHCGTTLPHRLPSGRRPKYVCHNCGCGLGRETDEDTKKYAEE